MLIAAEILGDLLVFLLLLIPVLILFFEIKEQREEELRSLEKKLADYEEELKKQEEVKSDN